MTEPTLTYDDFHDLAAADPAVVGLVLIGSQAHEGLVTDRSDHDLWVVLADGAASGLERFRDHRTALLDLVLVTLTQFREAGMPGFCRYAVARGRVVLDRLDGEIAAIVEAKQRLEPEAASAKAAEDLDDYANSLYRSLKNGRDGFGLASRLDAADSLGSLFELLFAMDRRPRPYNKYLEWELAHHPLPDWETGALLETVGRIAATADPAVQRRLFADVEAKARKAGHGAVLDAWGADLDLLRPQ
ncbi:hypothetical protein [Glycomyces harbinensis]|uniref:Nucleotidyltransferase domain-containing protein n=1 Tax=Glycomyces harbinensis TaxID=58114 RepID=A0A1G6R9K3_9ACTN|nr:hypothetical protein [Glycomyces harbinensis]SDD01103.1 hypothetical protein SAMN05216270_101370 [Glycomyces harbinensis]